jgi:hypothetical protein
MSAENLYHYLCSKLSDNDELTEYIDKLVMQAYKYKEKGLSLKDSWGAVVTIDDLMNVKNIVEKILDLENIF